LAFFRKRLTMFPRPDPAAERMTEAETLQHIDDEEQWAKPIGQYAGWLIGRINHSLYAWKGLQGEHGCVRAMSSTALFRKTRRANESAEVNRA
jgi:hypothetical protein